PGESTTEASRCVFVIDDKQIIRAMIYYPLTTGRNLDEIVRLVSALQATDQHGLATPANGRPGDRLMVPPPKTQEEAEERVQDSSVECTDWYFCTKKI
ncbi:MAG: peroxiredoxin, partial [Thermoanaerobaculia bacterium]